MTIIKLRISPRTNKCVDGWNTNRYDSSDFTNSPAPIDGDMVSRGSVQADSLYPLRYQATPVPSNAIDDDSGVVVDGVIVVEFYLNSVYRYAILAG
jgi:hypothetical protein